MFESSLSRFLSLRPLTPRSLRHSLSETGLVKTAALHCVSAEGERERGCLSRPQQATAAQGDYLLDHILSSKILATRAFFQHARARATTRP